MRLAPGKRMVKAPTLTVSAEGTPVGARKPVAAVAARTHADRVLRPLTDEEANYELCRARKNSSSSAASNLRIKGKQSIQISRRVLSSAKINSYDQF